MSKLHSCPHSNPTGKPRGMFWWRKPKLLLKCSPTTLKSNLVRETTSLFISLSSPQFPGIVFWNVNGAWMAQGAALNPVVPIGPQHPFGPTGVGQGRSSASPATTTTQGREGNEFPSGNVLWRNLDVERRSAHLLLFVSSLFPQIWARSVCFGFFFFF